MNAAAVLRRAYPDSTYKSAANDFRVTVDAIKWWVRYGFPKAREEQLRALLEARLEEQAEDIASHLQMLRGELGKAPAPTGLSRRSAGGGTQSTIEVARAKGRRR